MRARGLLDCEVMRPCGDARDAVLTSCYPFSSFISALKKRQSVP
jgi:hypothetical protein